MLENHLTMPGGCHWTPKEDKKLLDLYDKLGNDWTAISKKIPGRSYDGVRFRWKALQDGRGGTCSNHSTPVRVAVPKSSYSEPPAAPRNNSAYSSCQSSGTPYKAPPIKEEKVSVSSSTHASIPSSYIPTYATPVSVAVPVSAAPTPIPRVTRKSTHISSARPRLPLRESYAEDETFGLVWSDWHEIVSYIPDEAGIWFKSPYGCITLDDLIPLANLPDNVYGVYEIGIQGSEDLHPVYVGATHQEAYDLRFVLEEYRSNGYILQELLKPYLELHFSLVVRWSETGSDRSAVKHWKALHNICDYPFKEADKGPSRPPQSEGNYVMDARLNVMTLKLSDRQSQLAHFFSTLPSHEQKSLLVYLKYAWKTIPDHLPAATTTYDEEDDFPAPPTFV